MSKSSEAVKTWRATSKQRMIDSMGGKCQCCGYNKCNNALAFHHLDPTEKDLGFGSIRANPTSWPKIALELRKCILVCHNCHSEIHFGLREVPATYTQFKEEYFSYKITTTYNECPVCNTLKPESHKFCSHKCAQTNRRKVDWDKVDLLALMKVHKISELEKMLNISNAAIYKRRDKILKSL